MKKYLIALLITALPYSALAATPTLPTYANPAAVKAALDKAHDSVTLDANIQSTFSLATQVLGFQAQAPNTVLAGPASGENAAPTFRALGATEISADTTNFDNNLGADEDTTQKALDKLDDLTLGDDQSANEVPITDTGEYTEETDVEGAIQELYATKQPVMATAGQAEMEAGTETAIRSMSPLRVAQAIAAQVDISARTVTAHGSVSSGTEDFSPGIHTVTVSGVFAWAFTSWPASGTEGVIRAYITNGGSASFTGWGDVVWEGGVAPTLQASGLDVVTFTSLDGGTTVYGFLAGEDMQ